MADVGDPSGYSSSPQDVGERVGSVETRIAELTTLVSSLVKHLGEQGESSESVAAPGGSGSEAGMHLCDATGRTAGSTGRALGLSMSSVGVGSTSFQTLGLNPNATAVGVGSMSVQPLGLNPNANFVGRSSAGAAGFGSIGTGSGALGSQSSVPPPSTAAASEWWGYVASGSTLIPGAGVINETGESLGRSSFEVPKAPDFDGTEVSYPLWSQNFLLNARQNLYDEAFVSEGEIPSAEYGFDLIPWPEKRSSAGAARKRTVRTMRSLKPA